MDPETTAFIAIGSNIDPIQQITHCLELLGQMPRSQLFAESDWYLTRPWGMEQQADFVNLIEIASGAIHPAFGLPVQALTDRIRYRQIIGPLTERPRPQPRRPGNSEGDAP